MKIKSESMEIIYIAAVDQGRIAILADEDNIVAKAYAEKCFI